MGDAVTVELQRECIDDMYLANFINSVSLIYVKCTPVIASMVKPILHACVVWHQMLGVREEDIKWSTVREVVTCYEAHGVPLPPDVSEACTTLFLYFILSHVIIEHLCTGSLYNSIIQWSFYRSSNSILNPAFFEWFIVYYVHALFLELDPLCVAWYEGFYRASCLVCVCVCDYCVW